MSVVGIVLAGGASTRFGSDKLAAMVDGTPLLHRSLAATLEAADRVVLVLAPGAPAPELPPALAERVTLAHDDAAHRGPLAGVATGLRALGGDDVALVVAGDMPTLQPSVLRLLVEALRAGGALDAVTLEAAGSPPLPLALRARAVPAAEGLLREDRRSLRALLDGVPSGIVGASAWRPLDPDGLTLRDIDRPGDVREPG